MVEFWCCSRIDTHYTFHGGFSALGAGSGALCVHLASIVGSVAWYYGAALSLLHIMLIAVDLLVMDILVVCFIFLLMELPILLIGIVVLLYHCTHYTDRGGRSNLGAYCGTFFINGSHTTDTTDWSVSAALCVHIILYVVVILIMVLFVVHSLFLLSLLLLVLIGVLVLLYMYTLYCTWWCFFQ